MRQIASAVNGSVLPKIRILRFALSVLPTARSRPFRGPFAFWRIPDNRYRRCGVGASALGGSFAAARAGGDGVSPAAEAKEGLHYNLCRGDDVLCLGPSLFYAGIRHYVAEAAGMCGYDADCVVLGIQMDFGASLQGLVLGVGALLLDPAYPELRSQCNGCGRMAPRHPEGVCQDSECPDVQLCPAPARFCPIRGIAFFQ